MGYVDVSASDQTFKISIEKSEEQCPVCKMVLVEKGLSHHKHSSEQTHTSSSKAKSEEKSYKYYTPPPKYSSPKKEFQMPKNSGWIISIVGSIALSVLFSGYHSSSNPLPAPVSYSDPLPATAQDLKPMPTIPVPHAPYYSLPNGTVIFSSPSSLNGNGILTISNGSGSDAVVKLITNGGKKIYTVYIRANDDTFNFETIDEGDSIQYSRFTITLNPVIDGKATTSTLDPSAFDKY